MCRMRVRGKGNSAGKLHLCLTLAKIWLNGEMGSVERLVAKFGWLAAVAMGGVLVAGLLTGCAENRQYRTLPEAGKPAPVAPVIEEDGGSKIGYVELDDQGRFWDDRQREAVLEMVRGEAGLATAKGRKAVLLVVFVHGWKGNASPGDDNVKAFKKILAELRKAEASPAPGQPSRTVVGVYVGWRGLTARWEPFRELSFWDRKEVAHRVGGYGALTQLLVNLADIQHRTQKKPQGGEAQPMEMVTIGHSFGGAAVYSAVSEITVEHFTQSIEDERQLLKPLGDQVILLNPAFEAARHWDLDFMAHHAPKFPKSQQPVLTVFTSETDWATHYAFPAGRTLATLFDATRDEEQKKAGREAVGWYTPFVTHDLVPKAAAKVEAAGMVELSTTRMSQGRAAAIGVEAARMRATTRPTTLDPATGRKTSLTEGEVQASTAAIRGERERWRESQMNQTYAFDDTVLIPRGTYPVHDPILVVKVDRRIMDGHNDIDNPTIVNFIRDYIVFCRSKPGAGETTVP